MFILPQLISLVCLGIIPIVIAFVLSFFDWNGFSAPVFTGFQNFKAVFTDPDTGIAIKNTLVYSVIYVPCSIVLSLGLAMLLNKAWGKMFYRAVSFSLRLLPLWESQWYGPGSTSRSSVF
mgnify:FL=1